MKSYPRAVFIIGIVAIILALLINTNNVPIGDEILFLERGILPYLAGETTLHNYGLPMTPLYLIIFSTIYDKTHDLVTLRLANGVIFISLLFLVLKFSRSENDFYKMLLLIAITPYFLFLAVSAYTDMLFLFLLFVGIVLYGDRKYFLSCILFILAISTRQYGVVFPAALVLSNFSLSKRIDKRRWIYPLISCFTLVFWFIFFGFNLVPTQTYAGKFSFNMMSGILFLATYTAFYKIPEFMLFKTRNRDWIKRLEKLVMVFGIAIIFTLIIFLAPLPDLPSLLTPHHWFYLLATTKTGLFFIPFLAAFSLVFTRHKFELMTLILGFLMYCFIDAYFDKYITPFVLVMGYVLIRRKR